MQDLEQFQTNTHTHTYTVSRTATPIENIHVLRNRMPINLTLILLI